MSTMPGIDGPDSAPAPHADPHEDLVALPETPKVSRARLVGGALGAAAVLAGLFLGGWLPRRALVAETAAASAERATSPRRAEVVKPRVEASLAALTVPGSVEALRETAIWARASGYVRKWHVDLGDKVQKGQLLVELDTPELDQELVQARADLAVKRAGVEQARAGFTFSEAQVKRFAALSADGLTSQEDLEGKRSKAAVDQANVRAAGAARESGEANVQRLSELRAFARVVAPFDGVITARTVEDGMLVTAGTSGGQGLFRIAVTDPVRVFLQVPQSLAASVHLDTAAKVRVREYPNRIFEGKVTRSAGALDPASRTLRIEVHVPNAGGELLAGMYAQVAIELPSPHRTLYVPAAAVINDARGTRVAVVGDDGKLRFVPVQVERDTGAEVAIVSGLDGDERVVTTPGEDTVEGATLVAVERSAKH